MLKQILSLFLFSITCAYNVNAQANHKDSVTREKTAFQTGSPWRPEIDVI